METSPSSNGPLSKNIVFGVCVSPFFFCEMDVLLPLYLKMPSFLDRVQEIFWGITLELLLLATPSQTFLR